MIKEQKIIFFGRYIAEKSVFRRHREEKTEEKSIKGKIGKYRFPPKNSDYGAGALVLKFLKKNIDKISENIDKYR